MQTNLSFPILSSILVIGLFWSCSSPTERLGFPELTQESKPWTRWWWHGSSVTETGITEELEALAAAGIGGVEITPIYGVQGEESAFVDYLSEEWVGLLAHTLQEAERLDLGVDMATGTGWPFGGPWIGAEQACKTLEFKQYTLRSGERLEEKISYIQEPLLRTVRPVDQGLEDIMEPIAANSNLQQLALEQVRFSKPLPLVALLAYAEDGRFRDLTEKVDAEGQLDWQAPSGNWKLYALFQGWHGKMVERAAPGGEGNVPDHFSQAAIKDYLQVFDEALNGADIQYLRAFFNDSYEVDDARGQADWTPDLFATFEERRGYDLRPHIPALLSSGDRNKHRRILSDYRETIADLLLEHFTLTWSAWAEDKGGMIRNQAHGSPANILDLYAASDIPETEGKDMIKAKMASSAAHLEGKLLASAEAATWLDEHFTSNLADLKENIDRYLAAGINHVFYHGTCFSPEDEDWPGRLFYAAIHANPRNSLWEDYPALNTYIARTQAFLQAGLPDNDILLYFPAYDRFARENGALLEHFDGWATPRRGDTTEVRRTAEWLQKKGYAFDFISDQQLHSLSFQEGKLSSGTAQYQTIIVPKTEFMPLASIRQLLALREAGAKLVFQDWPTSVPGWGDLEQRSEQFDQSLAALQESGLKAQENLAAALKEADVLPEIMADLDLNYHRRRQGDHYIYFVSNWSGQAVDEWIPINRAETHLALFDPMSGRLGFAETRDSQGQTEVRLQLQPGESLILKTNTQRRGAPDWLYRPTEAPAIPLTGDWTLTFVKGGPELPPTQTLDQVQYWTALEGEAFQSFSGTAIYETSLTRPEASGKGILLDLGQVAESASVSINGHKVGTLIGPVYQIFLPENLINAENQLQIAVSNLMANRMAYLERSGKRWQKFYNINISANRRENIGVDGVFTAAHWSVKPSGLAGPVTYTIVQ